MPTFNVMFGWPILSDPDVGVAPVFTGGIGSWLAGAPITNLQTRHLREVARSTNALVTSTKFEADLGSAKLVNFAAIPFHTCSLAATIRIRGGSVSGMGSGVLYDSGTINVYDAVVTARHIARLNVGWTHVLATPTTARYWLVEITDTGNAAGYVDVGRLAIGNAWQPTVNMDNGAALGVEDESIVDTSPGGASIVTRRKTRRVTRFSITYLQLAESMANGLDMLRLAGVTEQVYFIFDPTDTTHMFRRAYMGRLRQLNALEYPTHGFHNIAFEIAEEF